MQFGANVRATLCYLYLGQFLSAKRTAQALSDLLGCAVSTGTVISTAQRAATALAAFTSRAATEIAAAQVAHFDETGLRRVPGVGALGLHQQVEPAERPPQAGQGGHGRRRGPARLRRVGGP